MVRSVFDCVGVRRARAWALLGTLAALAVVSHVSLSAQTGTGRQFYAAPHGLPTNDGSQQRPLDLATALSISSPLRPGDTLWLRDGRYWGNFESRLTGTVTQPIIVRQYPGERATLDARERTLSALSVHGSDTWYWGFEVTDTNPQRVNSNGLNNPVLRETSINVYGPRTRFINLVVHDGQQGFGFWNPAVDAEIYGSIISNVGVEAPDRGHGHSVYVQNSVGTKRIVDNVMFNSFSVGIHAYTSGGRIDNIHIEGNTLFNHGLQSWVGAKANVLAGGGDIADFTKVLNNYSYYPPAVGGRGFDLSYGNGCNSPDIRGNYSVASQPVNVSRCTNVVMTSNVLVGSAGTLASQYPQNTYLAQRPTSGAQVFVRPNAYESGRANITIFNWDWRPSVTVDISSAGLASGRSFEIRDAQNFFGPPVVTGVYDGTPVAIPMVNLTIAPPIGNAPFPPRHTAPEFGTFILLPTGSTTAMPTIADVRPASGPASGGTTIAITGTGFTSDAVVTVGGLLASSVSVSSGSALSAVTPSGAGVAEVKVIASGHTAVAPAAFTYTQPPPPVISSVSPASGSVDGSTLVTITGSGFGTAPTVVFGSTPATSVTRLDATRLQAVTPPASAGGRVDVTVTANGQTATSVGAFTYLAPTISSISPASGPLAGGATVNIYGTNFRSNTTVAFGTRPSTRVVVINASHVTAVAPAHDPGAVPVTVTTNGFAITRASAFTYLTHTATSLSPTSGPLAGGTVVTINGTQFGPGVSVSFGGRAATQVTLVSPTQLRATTPAGTPGPVSVAVTNGGRTVTASGTFTYLAPELTSLTPTGGSVAGGTKVTIYGRNFTAGATVSFGGNAASAVTFVNTTTLTAVTPAGSAGLSDVRVNLQGFTAAKAGAFGYLAPTISSLGPASGPVAGGTLTYIYGTNFVSGAVVQFGSLPATNVIVVSSGVMTAVAPAGAAAIPVEVSVTIAGHRAARAAAFTYLPPRITSISPASGTVAGGTLVTIYGQNFGAGASVTFAGRQGTTVTVVNSTALRVFAPAGIAGRVDVVVDVRGFTSTLPGAYTYMLPTVSSLSPSSGPAIGGTAVNIWGTNFAPGATVMFGTTPAANVRFVNATQLVATTRPAVSGTVGVTVTLNGQSVTKAAAFTFLK